MKGRDDDPLEVVGEVDYTGTTTHFKPDPEIFEELEFDFDLMVTNTGNGVSEQGHPADTYRHEGRRTGK